MADNTSFPMLSVSAWWNIRKKFKQTIPGTVTPNYLASILNMQERSAGNNIMPYLKQIGIIDQEGKTGDRAKMWRDDVDYPKVCEEIKNEIYPKELLDIPVSSNDDKESVKRWFARSTGTGEAAVNKITAFYFLLCEADPAKEPNTSKTTPKNEKSLRSKDTLPKAETKAVGKMTSSSTVKTTNAVKQPGLPPQHNAAAIPAININLQIHISSDASPEQIDKIFESMYKHIYSKKDDMNG
ncbi:MAG: DUF5343 domain-containing protein [Bacillota bacterium]